MGEIAFTTVHGSRLYGLDHAGSDKDSMIVYNDHRRAKHKKNGDEDVIHVGIFDLIEKAYDGSHQFVEGIFSQKKTWHDETYRPLIESLVIPGAHVAEKYERTIKKLCYENTKLRRHAVRLWLGLNQLRASGKMNPTLNAVQASNVRLLADFARDDTLKSFLLD